MAEEPFKVVLQKPPGYRVHTGPPPKPPARKVVLPPSFPSPRKRRDGNCCRICCCFLCVLLFTVVLFLLIAGALFYLYFDPKLPVFHIRSVRFPQFNVTSNTDDGAYLTVDAAVTVEAQNPNAKITFYYRRSELALTDSEEETELGSASFPEFSQGKKNTTILKFATGKKRTPLMDDGVGTRLKGRYRSKTLQVTAEVRTRVGLGVLRWRIGTVGVHVVCGHIMLRKLTEDAMPKCTINVLKWINIH